MPSSLTSDTGSSELQILLALLARGRPGEQVGTHKGVTYFHSLSRKHGGCTYQVHDFARGKAVAVASPFATHRRFVTSSGHYWEYAFPFTEAPIADISAFERQIAASTFVVQGHAADPR